MTSSLDANELHETWLCFLNSSKEQTENWLDTFLIKYLSLLCSPNENTKHSFSFQWRSSGNVLAHQLLSDVYQICGKLKASSVDENDCASISGPFKKYLLEGRGWKILWTLEDIGIQTLLCLKDLVKLLICHVPVILSLPLGASNIPIPLMRKPKYLDLEDCFYLHRRNKNVPQNINSRWSDEYIAKNKKNMLGKKRIRRKRAKAVEKESSSSSEEDPILLEPCAIPASQLKTITEVNRITSAAVQRSLSDLNESDQEVVSSESLLLPYMEDFWCYTISVIDYVHFILNLFQETAQIDHRNSHYNSSSSSLILEFSLTTLKEIHSGRYAFSGWTKEEISDLRDQILKLAFLSATVTYSSSNYIGAPNENEVISTLLTISEELMTFHKDKETISFVSCVLKGCLMLINNAIEMCSGDYAKVVCIIKLVYESGANLFYQVISYLDKDNGCTLEISDIHSLVSLTKGLIILLKFEKLSLLHPTNLNLDLDITNYLHHHNDIFGSYEDVESIEIESECCIASLSSLLLKLINSPVSNDTCAVIIRLLKQCGICCCMNPGFVLNLLLKKIICYDRECQHLILTLIEKYLFPQLGLTKKVQSQCSCCSKRLNNSDIITCLLMDKLINKDIKSLFYHLNEVGCTFWNSFSLYDDLLHSNSLETIELISKHLVLIFTDGAKEMKNQLFVRVILREFFQLPPKLPLSRNDSIKCKCFLSVLHLALHDKSSSLVFIKLNGIQKLFSYVLLKDFRHLALEALKILMHSESDGAKNFDLNDAFTYMPASVTFFDFLKERTQLFSAKISLMLSSEATSSDNIHSTLDSSEVYTMSEEKIECISDLWKCLKDVISSVKSESFSEISKSVVESGYNMFILLLENLSRILNLEELPEKKDVAKYLLLMIQSLLSICIKRENEVTTKLTVLEVVKSNIQAHFPKSSEYQMLLFDVILQCCFQSLPPAIPVRSNNKGHTFREVMDSSSSSDRDVKDLGSPDSYAGDTEGSSSCIFSSSAKYEITHQSFIEHGEVVKMLFEVLMHFQKDSKNYWVPSAIYVLQNLNKLCQECELNKMVLCEQDIPSLLLESFSSSLKAPEENLQLFEFQSVAMDLFVALSELSMEPSNLRKFISFFKMPFAPTTLLLKSLNTLIDNIVIHPIWNISFPCARKPLSSIRLKKRQKSAINAHTAFLTTQSNACAWNFGALSFPITEDTKWNAFNKGFSFSLWLKVFDVDHLCPTLIPGSTHFSTIRRQLSGNHRDLFGSDIQMLHLASVGSEKFMLEFWYACSDRDLVIRILTFDGIGFTCISKAVCKSLFHCNTWHHLALNYTEANKRSSISSRIQIVLDGTRENVFNLSFKRPSNALNDCHIILGHTESCSAETKFIYAAYSIGSFMFFKGNVLTRDIIFYLVSLGPNMTNITNCAVEKRNVFVPKYTCLTITSEVSLDVYMGMKAPTLESLQDSLLCSYTADKVDSYLVYPPVTRSFFPIKYAFPRSGSSRSSSSNEGLYSRLPSELQCLVLGNVSNYELHTFQYALQHAGGISIFLFLFAYVLEHSESEEDSHVALGLILKLLNKNTVCAEDFIRVKGYELLTQMIISQKCKKTNDLFKVFQQNCLTSCPMHEKLMNGNLVKLDKPSVVSNSAIFSLMMKSIAFAKDTPESVLVSLFSTMDFLLDLKFADVQINVEQINHVQTLSTLLWLLKRNYIMSEEYFSSTVANKVCTLIQSLLRYKFDESIFKDLCHFLLLLQKTSSAYVCHSRPSFFFFEIVDKLDGKEKVDTFSASVWFAEELNTPVLETYNQPSFQTSDDPSDIGELSMTKDSAILESSMKNNKKSENFAHSQSFTESSSFNLDAEKYQVLSDGSSEICIGFLKLIHTFISSEDSDVFEIALQLLQPEILIVLAYNENTDVCVFSLKVLGIYLKEANETQRDHFLSLKGFHLLSNQLHLRQFDDGIFDACFSYIFNFPLSAINPSRLHLPSDTPLFRTLSWLPLLAILPDAVSDLEKCEKIILILTKFLQASTTVLMDLLENGLCMSIFRLLFQVTPLLKKDEIDSNDRNMNPCLRAISSLFQTMATSLFSSKQNKDFNALLDVLHLLSDLENKYTTEKGPKSRYMICLRVCQCSIYSVIVEFSKFYNVKSLKSRSTSQNEKTIWELLTEFQESIGTYSTVSVPVADVAMEPDLNVQSRIGRDNLSPQTDIHEALLHVPIPTLVSRLELLLGEATHFIVFKDPQAIPSMREKYLIKAIFNFYIKGLVLCIEKATNKTDYTALMCCLKDSLKKELGSLMIFLLSPNQDLKLKEFTIEILTLHPSNRKILHLVLTSMARFENFLIFLNELQFCEDPDMRTKASVLCNLVLKLMQNSPSLEVLGDTNLVEKFKSDWTSLWNKDRRKWIDETHKCNIKVFQKMEKHAQDISSVALKVTEKIFEIQINQRRVFMDELKLKYYEEASERMAWFRLVEQMTHERAVWHIPESYPHSWELDPTEGPFRIRRRLKRCYINVEPRFLKPDYVDRLVDIQGELPFVNLLLHHNEFPDSAAVLHRLHTHEQIEFTSTCKIVTAFEEAEVEILIGASCIHLIGEQALSIVKKGPISESWPFDSIKEIVPRRYELQNNAFEVFLTNGSTYLIAFQSEKEFQYIWKRLESHGLPCQPSTDVSALTQLWRESSITNFEYLTQLNKLAGRSFNDLMQYPVFPFILADYMNSHLNLLDQAVYRNLEKPVAVQHKYREKYYNDMYNMLKDQSCGPFSEAGPHMSSPYHYGSHYSNSGTVLHFLIRLLPYTYSFIKYQDNNFDIPDRTFHSVDTSWRLVTKESTSDVKELIPEFFFLPEFLSNKNGFDFGVRQSGIRVNDVLLPPWCKQNPRLFILIHRQALESDAVTKNIHNWIDLIFGYKQTGEAAINAINVYQPTTYFGFDTNQWKDPITRKALKAMVKTLGQMPKQLFAGPHPMVSLSLACLDVVDESSDSTVVIDTVTGLRWGNYVGSPSTATPSLVWCRKQNVVIGCFLPLHSSSIFGLGENICLLLNQKKNAGSDISSTSYIMSAALVSWGYKDSIVRIKLCRDQPAVPLLKGTSVDPVCLCASVPDCKELFVAHSSGIIAVYTLYLSSSGQSMIQEQPPLQLNGHTDSVTSIHICKTFSIFVSSSKDCSVIVWDLNKLSYVHCLTGHTDAVQLVTVSDTLGDIASVSTDGEESNLQVHTINGEIVGSVKVPGYITAMCYSTAPEGTSVNVIATGLHSGKIRLWSSWDLKPVREIICDRFCLPIKCVVFSMDNQHLFASNENGTVAVWEKPSKGLTSVPRLLVFT